MFLLVLGVLLVVHHRFVATIEGDVLVAKVQHFSIAKVVSTLLLLPESSYPDFPKLSYPNFSLTRRSGFPPWVHTNKDRDRGREVPGKEKKYLDSGTGITARL